MSEEKQEKKRRGFSAMSPEKQREIASKGGKAVSRDSEHMRNIGKIGGSRSKRGKKVTP